MSQATIDLEISHEGFKMNLDEKKTTMIKNKVSEIKGIKIN